MNCNVSLVLFCFLKVNVRRAERDPAGKESLDCSETVVRGRVDCWLLF